MAESANAEVHLIEVVDPSEAKDAWVVPGRIDPHTFGGTVLQESLAGPISGVDRRVAAETKVQAEERFRQEAEGYLHDVAGRFFAGGAERKVVMGEHPAEEIANYARREKVDFIAIATHGRTGLARLTMWSVAGELLRDRVAPLFMIGPDQLH